MLKMLGWTASLASLLAVLAGPAAAQVPADPCAAPVDDPDLPAAAAAQEPGLDAFPVFVHYMRHGDSTEQPDKPDGFTVPMLKTLFQRNGAFNKIWTAQRVRFVLVGINSCQYKLASFSALEGRFAESFVMPDPTTISARRLFVEIASRFRAKKYKVGTTMKIFRGLDLYLWASIEGGGGYGLSSTDSHEGAVWLDKDCIGDQPHHCTLLFAHEVGHFFGLCHVCRQPGSVPNPLTCKQVCPVSAGPGTPPSCSDPSNVPTTSKWSDKSLMADGEGSDLADCEVEFAIKKAKSVLQIN